MLAAPLHQRLTTLRDVAKVDLLRLLGLAPLSLVGHVTHAPIALLSLFMGRKMGVAADGDRSVEATVRVIAGFVGVGLYYPAAAITAAVALDSVLAAPVCLATLALSGYAAITLPVADVARNADGNLKLLTASDNVDKLRARRQVLITKKSRNLFRVGIFLDFVWLTTRTMHPHGAYVWGARRNRIERHRGGIERLATRTRC